MTLQAYEEGVEAEESAMGQIIINKVLGAEIWDFMKEAVKAILLGGKSGKPGCYFVNFPLTTILLTNWSKNR